MNREEMLAALELERLQLPSALTEERGIKPADAIEDRKRGRQRLIEATRERLGRGSGWKPVEHD